MPVSSQIKAAALEMFPNATDEEIESNYNQIRSQLVQSGDMDVTDEDIINTFKKVVPELQKSMSTGPVMGDVERAEKRYADELAKLKMGRTGDLSMARAADVWANWRGQTDPRQKGLLDKFAAEDQQLKDLTIGAADRMAAARKEDMGLRKSEQDLATSKQQYDITKQEQERAARLRDPNSEESNALRAQLKPLVGKYGVDPEQLDGLNVEDMKSLLNLSQEAVDMSIKQAQEKRLTSAEDRARRGETRIVEEEERERKRLLNLREPKSWESQKRREAAKGFLRLQGVADDKIAGIISDDLSAEEVDNVMDKFKDMDFKQSKAQLTSEEKKKQDVEMGVAISEAEKLIDKATASGIGSWLDDKLRFIGASTEGADAIAQLRIIEGKMLASIPRFEGPQSDKDIETYRQMIGQVADPTVPVSQKKAALETMKALRQKYKEVGGESQQGPTVVERRTINGRVLEKMSDGSVREVK